MNYLQLLEQVKLDALQFFLQHESVVPAYHNKQHTESIVARTMEIASYYQLNDENFFIVSAAAWCHDLGYLTGGAIDHEKRGADIATGFLHQQQAPENVILQVNNCIMATQMPQHPKTLCEQIVCDADLYHLGTHEFDELNRSLRKEMELRMNKKISKSEWRLNTIRFLEAHQYHTAYCKEHLEGTKQENLARLRQKAEDKHELSPDTVESPPQENGASADQKKQKQDRPERGIETMFRITSGNHQRLSDMADNKAHIMITTTSIIISVLLSILLRKLEDNPYLILPTILLLAVCVTTMVSCILATRPNLPSGSFTAQDIADKKVNLLFFGNFYKMNYEEYYSGMRAMMNDREFLYGSLTRDIYSQGVVLGRKYRLLRIGYSVFMFGIVASVLAFVIASAFFSH